MPADPVHGLVFALLFLGGVAGLLYVMARLELPRPEPLPRYAPRRGTGTTLTRVERGRPTGQW